MMKIDFINNIGRYLLVMQRLRNYLNFLNNECIFISETIIIF